MKRTEAIELIYCLNLDISYGDVEIIIQTMEDAGFLSPSYLIPDKNGFYNVHYGWEDET